MDNYANNLFKTANKLRGKIPPSDYKFYVLPLVFIDGQGTVDGNRRIKNQIMIGLADPVSGFRSIGVGAIERIGVHLSRVRSSRWPGCPELHREGTGRPSSEIPGESRYGPNRTSLSLREGSA